MDIAHRRRAGSIGRTAASSVRRIASTTTPAVYTAGQAHAPASAATEACVTGY
jgi:hypothetical protein